MIKHLALVFALCVPSAVAADEDQFVFDNLTGTFYHELAHALVDQLDLAIFGQEEDAADVLAAYLITEWHEGAEVRRLGRHVALTFFSDYFSDERSGRDVVWDGVHGPAKQRMYNHLCVMIGSDPDGLSDIGTTFEMERGRLKDCDTEYDAAKFSWGAVIDGLIEGKGEGQLIVTGIDSYMNRFVGQWAQAEIARINSVITFPNDIPVAVIKCGQSNA
ncbi:MAG: DUF4344 domain-containing metallopeptidase, partial [Planktomarina sp.]